jgi:putative ABC transport system permease protein
MLQNYLKLALRVLLRRKFFTAISLFAVSLTLTVLTVASAALDHVFGPHAPEVHADRTLAVLSLYLSGPRGSQSGGAGYGFLDRHVRDLPGAERVSLSSLPDLTGSYVNDTKVRLFLKRTDAEFWRILQFTFTAGGPFGAEDVAGRNRVAVINQATAARFFGSAEAVGRTLEIEGQSFRVVGVVSDVPIMRILPFSDVWVPIGTTKGDAPKDEVIGDFMALILVRDRALIPAIQDEFQARLAAAAAELPDPQNFDTLSGAAETFFEAASRFLFDPRQARESHPGRLWAMIVGAALLFMTLPAINLVNLNLSRILERASEIGVRKAFGATSRTLVGQFVVENVVLTLIGGALGTLFSAVTLWALNHSELIPYSQLQLNLRVLLAGLALALVFGLLSGVYPAWRMSRMHPVEALHGRSE